MKLTVWAVVVSGVVVSGVSGCEAPTAEELATSNQALTVDTAAQQRGRARGRFLDLNGDGLADLAVGAPGTNTTYIYYGNRGSAWRAPAATLVGSLNDGSAVAAAGDVNADGFGDLVVGSGNSTAVVYLGGRRGVSPTGTALDNGGAIRFGATVSAAGDLNGDGFGDVIIGTRYGSGIYLGGAAGIVTTPSQFISGPGSAGLTVLGGVDFNRDTHADVGVGSGNIGVNIFLGGAAGLPPAASATFAGTGGAVPAGDINRDGYADLLVAAAGGRVDVYAGGPQGLGATPLVSLSGPGGSSVGDAIGFTMSSAGDINGDGYDDIVLGTGASDTAYLYLGRAGGPAPEPSVTLTGVAASGFGLAVAGVGDVNGDGYDDVVIGAPAGTGPGQAQLFLGGRRGLATRPIATLTGPASFGTAIARFSR